MKAAFSTILLFVSLSVIGQSIDSLFNDYHSSHYVEKIYVAMDKPYYVVEDEIWAKAYMVYGRSHVLIDIEPIIYADWIDPDGNTIDTYQLKIKDGVAPFSIKTTLEDKVGVYTLRVYSPYQLNFDTDYIFQKEVRLLNSAEFMKSRVKDEDLSIQFFPEGGYLVDGLKSKLAFKVWGVDDEDQFKGVIKNGKGEFVSNFKIWKNTIGRVDITPQKGERYIAELKYGDMNKSMALPSSLTEGYVMSAHSQDDEKISITLSSNMDDGLEGAHLIAHVRGMIVSSFTLMATKKMVVSLEKDKLPSGVVHLTLFNPENLPVSERLIFNRNPQDHIDVDIDLPSVISKSKLISGSISSSQTGQSVRASANISIYNRDVLPDEWRSVDIQSYLWLQSDLKGKVDFIADYVAKDDKRSRSFMDLVLTTHGWRRFEWQRVLQSDYPELLSFSEEKTVIKGQITKLKSDKPVKADVALNIVNEELFAALQVTTGEDGYFQFEGIDLPDSVDIIIQAATHKKKKSKKVKAGTQKLVGNRYVKVKPLLLPEFSLDTSNSLLHYPFSNYDDAEELDGKVYTQSVNRSKVLDNSVWSIDIDEVVVSARRYSAQAKNRAVEKRYKEKGIFFFASTDKFVADDPQYDGLYFATIHDMLRGMIPGSKKIVRGGRQVILLQGLSGPEPRIVIDGYMVPEGQERNLNPSDVFSVDIITGLRASALYDVGAVISIVTKNPSEKKKYFQSGLLSISHPGYHKARQYYVPRDEELSTSSDYRTTIFWDPNVNLKEDRYTFSFRTSDLLGIHQVVVEGLTSEGIPFVSRKFINVVE